MCAQFFYQREASAKLSPNLIRAPLVDDKCPEPLGNERTSAWLWSVCCWAPRQPPWFPSGLAPCLSFPLLYTPVLLPSTVLSTSGLSRNTQLLSQFLGLRFVMTRRLTLELKTWISAWILLLKLLYPPLFRLEKDSVTGLSDPQNDNVCGCAFYAPKSCRRARQLTRSTQVCSSCHCD